MNFNQPIDIFVAEKTGNTHRILLHTRQMGTLTDLADGMMDKANAALEAAQKMFPNKQYEIVVCPSYHHLL